MHKLTQTCCHGRISGALIRGAIQRLAALDVQVVEDAARVSNTATVRTNITSLQTTAAHIVAAALQINEGTNSSSSFVAQTRPQDSSDSAASHLLVSGATDKQLQDTASGPRYTLQNVTLWCAPSRQHAVETISAAEALSAVVGSSTCFAAQLTATDSISLARAQAIVHACTEQQTSVKSPEIVTPVPATISREPLGGPLFQQFAQWEHTVGMKVPGCRRRVLATLPAADDVRLGRRGMPAGSSIGLVLGVFALVISCIGAHLIVLLQLLTACLLQALCMIQYAWACYHTLIPLFQCWSACSYTLQK